MSCTTSHGNAGVSTDAVKYPEADQVFGEEELQPSCEVEGTCEVQDEEATSASVSLLQRDFGVQRTVDRSHDGSPHRLSSDQSEHSHQQPSKPERDSGVQRKVDRSHDGSPHRLSSNQSEHSHQQPPVSERQQASLAAAHFEETPTPWWAWLGGVPHKKYGEIEQGTYGPIGTSESWPSASVVTIEFLLLGVCLLLWLRPWRSSTFASSNTKPCLNSLTVPTIDPAEPKLLHQRFVVIAQKDPDRLALIDGDHQETFGQLLSFSLSVARHLVESRGVKPSSRTPIGVCAEGRYLMRAIYGIVQTGNPYLPLPSNLPATQRDFIVTDAKVTVVLADPTALAPGGVWAGRVEASPAHALTQDLSDGWKPSWKVQENDLAYVLYTSGSTGKPKGVLAPHTAHFHRLAWMWLAYPFADGEVGIQKTATSWVDHVQELFLYLGGGVPLVLAPPETRIDTVKLLALCRQHSVSRLVLVPSLLRVITESFGATLSAEMPTLRYWICSGEPFPVDMLQNLLKVASPGSIVFNTYGTTECAGDVTWSAYDSNSTLPQASVVPIGIAIPPNKIHLLDPETLTHVAQGEPGEIFVEGPHVACGYHNRQEEDRARFLAVPSVGIKKAFRTGDFGKLDKDMQIEFLGRKDQQVKVHGQRVEILQVEAALGDALMEENGGVKPPNAVMAIPSEKYLGSYRLLAFVETAGSTAPNLTNAQILSKHMGKSLLPGHIPESFVALNKLPRLVNGKLDRVSLKQVAMDHVSKAGKEQDASVTERDSFGQIRKILAEHVDARRAVGTMCTVALFIVVIGHWACNSADYKRRDYLYAVSSQGRVAISPWAKGVVRMMITVNDDALLMAGIGALHGMGDQSKFQFSLWEPAFLALWYMIKSTWHAFDLPHEGVLWFLITLFIARVWVILWHKAVMKIRGSETLATNMASMLLPACLWIFRMDPITHTWAGKSALGHQVLMQNNFDVFAVITSVPFIHLYALGFYFGPKVMQIGTKLRSRSGCLQSLALWVCILVLGRMLRAHFEAFWAYSDAHGTEGARFVANPSAFYYARWTKEESEFSFLCRFLAVALNIMHINAAMVFFASLPVELDLTTPGPAQMAIYLFQIPLLVYVQFGVTIGGLKLFPSLPDLFVMGSRAWAPLDGAVQLMTILVYITAYFLLVIGIYKGIFVGIGMLSSSRGLASSGGGEAKGHAAKEKVEDTRLPASCPTSGPATPAADFREIRAP